MGSHGYNRGMKRARHPLKMAPRLVAVVRVSTERQADPDASPATQRRLCESFCDLYGIRLVAVHEDATSGKRAPQRRPGMARALAMLAAGEADGLLVSALSRLSRSTKDVLALVDLFQRRAWRLVSVKEQLDTDTAHGRMVLTILSSVAQHEREQLQERLRDRAHRLMREGRCPTPKVPLGFSRVAGSDRLVRNEAEHRVQAQIHAMSTRSGLGTHAIAKRLNQQGVPHPRTGKRWTRPAVRSVLATNWRRARILRSI